MYVYVYMKVFNLRVILCSLAMFGMSPNDLQCPGYFILCFFCVHSKLKKLLKNQKNPAKL